jgi:hypothetical protein
MFSEKHYSILMPTQYGDKIVSAVQETPCECEEELIMYILDLWMYGHVPLPFLKPYVHDCCPASFEKIEALFSQAFPLPEKQPPLPNDTPKNEWFIVSLPIHLSFYVKKEILNAIFGSEDAKKQFFQYLVHNPFSMICIKPNSILS